MSLLDKYLEKGLVIKNGIWYQYRKDGKNISICKKRAEAESKLKQLIDEGLIQEISDNAPPETLDSSVKPGNLTPEIIPPKTTTDLLQETTAIDEMETEKLEALLGSITDIKPSVVDETAIFYKGVFVWDVAHPIIKKLPVTFRWRRRGKDNQNIIKDGHGNYTCLGWQVFMTDSEYAKAILNNLRILRNDTPGTTFITNGDMVLCVARKDEYEQKKLKQALSGMKKAIKEKERRQELGRNFAKMEIKEAEKALSAVNTRDDETYTQHQKDLMEIAALKEQL